MNNPSVTLDHLLLKLQSTVCNQLEGRFIAFLVSVLKAQEGGIHVEVAIIALMVFRTYPHQDNFFLQRRNQFVLMLLLSPNLTKTLEKILGIKKCGFFKPSHEGIKTVENFPAQIVPELKQENVTLRLQKAYDKLLSCSNYFTLSKLAADFLGLLESNQKWEQKTYDYFFDLVDTQYQLVFNDFEKNEISKIIFRLHSPQNKRVLKQQHEANMIEYLNLCSRVKSEAGEEILAFFILSTTESLNLDFGDILRGLNLLLLQLNSDNFFVVINEWMQKKYNWNELLENLEANLTKTRLDNSYFQDDILSRLEKFKSDPTVKKALSQEELRLIYDQYKIIDGLREKYSNLCFHELMDRAHELRNLAKTGLIDPFNRLQLIAIACLAISDEFGIYPYSTQIFALLGLFVNGKNRQAQVNTGEGKSLIIALWAFVMAMECRAVDIITSARYLAIRDHDKFAKFFQRCGITTGHICYDDKIPEHFKPQILYAPAFDFEFAWMEDMLWGKKLYQERLQNPYLSRNFDAVCVDEADNLLIDNVLNGARLCHPAEESFEWVYAPILLFVRQNKKLIEEEPEQAISQLRQYLKNHISEQNYSVTFQLLEKKLMIWLQSAYVALFKFKENKEYILHSGKKQSTKSIKIMELQTGRIFDKGRWSGGLHEFLELKHDVPLQKESITPITLSHSVFYQFYKTIAALTGTKEEFQTKEIYQIESFDVPPHHPLQRKDLPPVILENEVEAVNFVVQNTRQIINANRPILILCPTIYETQKLADRMKSENIHFQLLNEVQKEDESVVLSRAGDTGRVTIATNTAGRGTDIILSDESLGNGGLHVLLTFYPESERVQDQAIGRGGRQGQPGSSQTVLHKEDPLIRKLLKRHNEVFSNDQIIELLDLERKMKEKSLSSLHLKYAEMESFLAEKTHVFFSFFQKWVSETNQDAVLEKFAQKLKSFNIDPSQKLNFDQLCKADLIIAESCKNLISKNSDTSSCKIFLQQVVERMKKKIINEWVSVFFEPSETRVKSAALKMCMPLNNSDNLNHIEDLFLVGVNKEIEAIKLTITLGFNDFRPKWEKYLAEDCSGLFVYLSEITTLNLEYNM